MSIIHITQIKNQVAKLFDNLIDLSDVKSDHADPKMIEQFFLTRALAAYSIYYLGQVDASKAADAVTDGGDDNGIDAIYFDDLEKRLYIVQSKWIQSGSGEPENGDVKKFIGGIKDLFNLDFDRFNAKINNKKEIVVRALTDPSTKYEVVLVYTGNNTLAEPSSRDFRDLSDEMNDAGEVLSISVLNQKDLYTSLTTGISGEPISLDIGVKSWGRIDAPYTGYYGQVDGAQIASWWGTYRTRLFTKNLRSVLGDTDVNAEIRDTIEKRPDLFWYFNNGITIVCTKVNKTMVGGADTGYGTFHCDHVSIVNGAQTVGAIGKFSDAKNEKIQKLLIPVRIISLENGYENFGQDITRTNNRQNRIENRDFVSLDPEQSRIKTELALEKVEYHLVRSESVSRTENEFDLVESTTAAATASGNVNLVMQLKREISKLWENIEKAPYKELFNATVSGLYLWRCVQTQRKIDKALDGLVKKLGMKSGREYGVAIHGNRLIAAMVFVQLNPKQFANPNLGFDDATKDAVIGQVTQQYYEKLRDAVGTHYPNAIIPTLFKNLTKCKHLTEVCLA